MDLVLENLSKRFGDRLAVSIPSLTIRGGDFFTLVGPSGCGKSTTLNLIAGLEEPTTGEIRLGGRELTGLPPQKRDVAVVFQSYALYPHRSVRGNLAFPLELAGTEREEIRRRVEETAALLNLAHLLDKRPRQLSGGERQRVALGRAIVREPQLFLLDEPLSNLDAPLRAQMRRELRGLHGRLKTTFIYVTHDQDEALSLSDGIALMREGTIQQRGTPQELYDRPANRFAASFFGSPPMNFIDGQLRAEGGELRIAVQDHVLRVPGGANRGEAGRPVALGIRPEHLRLGAALTADAWPAKIAGIELHGAMNYIDLDLAGFRLTAADGVDSRHRAGDQVWVELPQERLHVFAADSGERIGI